MDKISATEQAASRDSGSGRPGPVSIDYPPVRNGVDYLASVVHGQRVAAALGVIEEGMDTEPVDLDPEYAEDPGPAQAPEDEQLALFL